MALLHFPFLHRLCSAGSPFLLSECPSLLGILDLFCNISDAFQYFPHFAMYFSVYRLKWNMMDAVLNE